MDTKDFIQRRLFVLQRRLRGTGRALTIEVGDAYFQMASYEDNQLVVEVVSNRLLPDGAALDGRAQKALQGFRFAVPDDDWPNWNIRMDDATDVEIYVTSWDLTAALLVAFELKPSVIAGALLNEYIRSHQEYAPDQPWAESMIEDLSKALARANRRR